MNQTIRTQRVQSAVRALPMFRGLSPDDQQRSASLASLKDLQRGEVLWREGDDADVFTVIVRRRVKIVRQGDAGDLILEIFGEGEPAGAIAVTGR